MSKGPVTVGRAPVERSLLCCGVVAGPLFIGTFLVEGTVRDGYRPARHPISSLALGPRGWVQAANFAVAGTLYLAASLGLHRAADPPTRVGPALVSAAAAGMLGSGAFRADPVSGYPPGTPDAHTSYTPPGALHDAFAVPTFLGLPVAALVFGRAFARSGHRGWAAYSVGSGLTMLGAFALASAGFNQRPGLVDVAGAYQRGFVAVGFTWLSALAARALRSGAERTALHP